MMQAIEICQLPGCENPISQTAGGGKRKRFCSDQHRAQFWRLTHGQPRQAKASPTLTLHEQLEKSVHSLEVSLSRARATLLEVADQEARVEVQRLRQELTEQARLTQQQLATGAHETQAALAAAEFQLKQSVAEFAEMAAALQATNEKAIALDQRLYEETARHRDELEQVQARLRASHERNDLVEQRAATDAEHYRAELAAATQRQERTQERLERALAELRTETEGRARAEAGGQAAAQRIEELKIELAALREAPPPGGKLRLS